MTTMEPRSESELTGEQIASGLVPIGEICGDDDVDTQLLQELGEEANRYISSFSWCKTIIGAYFGGGVGGIFAVFFFHIQPSGKGVDPWMWIMVGDVPPAYLPLEDCSSPAEAIETYLAGMERWVELARKGETGSPDQGVPPVNVPATPEWAEQLNGRLSALRLAVKPFFEDDSQKSSIQ